MKENKKYPIVGVIWKETFSAFKANPVIFMPFALSGALKLFGLAVIFFSIFPPLSIVFAPIIRTLRGEMFLHYPFNFYLMNEVFYYWQITLYIILDGFLTGMAVYMLKEANDGRKPKFLESAKKVLPRYVTIASFLVIIFIMVYWLTKGENLLITKFSRLVLGSKLAKFKALAFIAQKDSLQFIMVFVNFIVIVLIEALFAFAIPFAVLEGKRFFRALWGSICLLKKFFIPVFLLILVPTTVSLPVTLIKTGLPVIMHKTIPDITMLVLGFNVMLVVFIDAIVSVSLAFLFLARKDI